MCLLYGRNVIWEQRWTNCGPPILLVPVKNDSIMNIFRKNGCALWGIAGSSTK